MDVSPSWKKTLILLITVLAPFTATLDASIVNVALPVLSRSLHTESSSVAWVSNIYTIVMAAAILFFGRLGDIRGQEKVFTGGMALFAAGSLLCSFASGFGELLAARMIQAAGGSAALANSQGIIVRTFPASQRGRALGLNGAFVALGMAAGPSAGGWLLAYESWPFIFLINLPVCALVILGALLLFPRSPAVRGRMDMKGTFLFASSVILFFYSLQSLGNFKAESRSVFGLLTVSLFLFFLFIRAQQKSCSPLLPLSLFRNRTFSISIFCAFSSFSAIGCYTLVLPFYLESIRALSPAPAGLYLASYAAVLIVSSPLGGWLADRWGAEKTTLLGLSLTASGLLLLTISSLNSPLTAMTAALSVMGLGTGLFQPPNNTLVMSSVSSGNYGITGSVNALMRYVGQAFGLCLSNFLLYGGMSFMLGYPVSDLSPGQEEAFLFGMRLACTAAALFCIAGAGMACFRLVRRAG
jgi:EmrB/QacA subfamily drug resistance transporter